jgi:choline dehydrogenase
MREIFVRIENNLYLSENDSLGHGFHGFMDISQGNSYYTQAPGRLALLGHLAESLVGHPLDEAAVLEYMNRDVNYDGQSRDHTAEPFGLPDHNNNIGRRWSPRDLILKAANSTNGRFKLQLETLATKILFDNSTAGLPKAIGVEFLEGKGVYGAIWKYDAATAPSGTLSRAWARKEVIISDGTFNSPQLLQLSGIGNATHLESLGIPVISNLPGVGLNLRDNQELPVAGLSPVNITTTLTDPLWANCTYGAPGDPCLTLREVGK